MKKSLTTLVALAATVFALATAAAPAAHAQGQAQVILTARAEAEPVVVALVDAGGARSQFNDQAAAGLKALIAGSDWSILEGGQLQISKDGKPVLGSTLWMTQDQMFFLVHYRGPKLAVDGTIARLRDDKSKGYGTLWVTVPSNDGKSTATFYIVTGLQFVGSNTTDNGGGFGGFGG